MSSDPHRSKIDPDDPRLRLNHARARTLKKGPAIALAMSMSGALLVAMVVAMQPAKPPAPGAAKTEAEPQAEPPPPPLPEHIRNASSAVPRSGPAPLPRLGVVPMPDAGPATSPVGARAARASGPPSAAEIERQRAREEGLKARAGGILFSSTTARSEPDHPAGAPSPALPAATAPARSTREPAAGIDEDQNLQTRKNAFLDSDGAANRKDYLVATVRKPKSPYEVKAGAVVPTVLVTAINSDLPGPVIAQVRENVYDTITGNYLLIPQGSKLLANYDSMVAWGQERVLLCWNRVIFPNGNSVDLDCMPGADLQGAAGLTDDVDHHWDRILKGAAISSLLAATTTGIAGSTDGFQPTVPQAFARNASGQINQVGQQITRKNINIQPTITIRPGYSVNVIITRDMIIPPYPDAALIPAVSNAGTRAVPGRSEP